MFQNSLFKNQNYLNKVTRLILLLGRVRAKTSSRTKSLTNEGPTDLFKKSSTLHNVHRVVIKLCTTFIARYVELCCATSFAIIFSLNSL